MQIFDSRSQTLRDFVPLVAGEAGLYVCGPTVQSSPHIGHLRSALVYDLLRRWLEYTGHRVTLVRNVTDIDDKVLVNAAAEGDPERWWALAYRYEIEFSAAYSALGIRPPSYEPRATGSIQQMHALIERLIDRGHAYPAPDGSGDVYFDTSTWSSYGELTRQQPDNMEAAADADPRAKRDPRDFALWKGGKPGEPASAAWPSPWGEGRPGWHIECSAMASRFLGREFDIHGGGLDLRFPHHENELAQSTAAGDPFARYWVHNGLVTVAGQKMSKSLGNSVMAADLLAEAAPAVIRYYLGSAHYRSTIDYHPGSLDEASAALDRITGFLQRSARRLAGTRFSDRGELPVPDAFRAAMDDDLAVPQGLAVLHETVRQGNAALDDEDLSAAEEARGAVEAMAGVLGLGAIAEEGRPDIAGRALEVLVGSVLAERAAARADRDFARADTLRERLSEAGVQIEDTPSGAQWRLDGE